MTSPFSFRLEQPSDSVAIDALHEAVFPAGWKQRAAAVLREGVAPDPRLSFVATGDDGRLVASVRMTPIIIGGRPAILLGPLAVSPEFKGQGTGRALVRTALDAARAAGHKVVMLVGDLPYYGPLGFTFLGRDVITLPAWVDPDRVLVAGLTGDALEGLGGPAERAR
jgi:predicted N-acetyltransferase YhbS